MENDRNITPSGTQERLPTRGQWVMGEHNVSHLVDDSYRFEGARLVTTICEEFEVALEHADIVHEPDGACLNCIRFYLHREAGNADWAGADERTVAELKRIGDNLVKKGGPDVI